MTTAGFAANQVFLGGPISHSNWNIIAGVLLDKWEFRHQQVVAMDQALLPSQQEHEAEDSKRRPR